MRDGVKTCQDPTDPRSLYIRNLYRTFFFGPFADEHECAAAIAALDKADPMWDYDPFCIIYGADPLPADYVGGFPAVPYDMRKRIETEARPK